MTIAKRKKQIDLEWNKYLESKVNAGQKHRQAISTLRLNNAIDGIQQLLGVTSKNDRLWDCYETLIGVSEDDRLFDDLCDMNYDFDNNDLNYKLEIFKRLRNRRYKRAWRARIRAEGRAAAAEARALTVVL